MTPLAQVTPITVPLNHSAILADEAAATTPNVHSAIPADKEATAAPGVHSTAPEGRGKMKLQFCIDHKVSLLEERLHVYEVLDRHLKEENVLLKERVTKLDQQLEDTKSQKTFLSKCIGKWYDEFQKA